MASLFKSESRRVYDAPLHVAAAGDGTVTIFFPDGHRLVLTADAAERSAAMLWRNASVVRSRRPGRPARRCGKVIAVDFSDQSLRT